MKKMMSLLMVALVALTISLELRSTAARELSVGPPEVQQHQVAATTTNNVAHQSVSVIGASKNALVNPQMFPMLEASPKDLVSSPQDVDHSVPSSPQQPSARDVIIPQHCICCGWYYSKYFTNCNKICCE